MKLTDSVVIHAPIQQVWGALIDPASWPDWNPKITRVVRSASGPVEVGETFAADFQLSGPPTPSQIKVRVLNPLRQFSVKQRPEGRHRSRAVKIDFEIFPEGASTRVTQTTDFKEAGLPWAVRALMWTASRFGKATGPSPLDQLKQKLERSATAASAPPAATRSAPEQKM
jgi:carbon monoxide dehydrogenase subunit G